MEAEYPQGKISELHVCQTASELKVKMSLEVLGIILALFKIGEDGWMVQSVTTTVSPTKGKNAGSTFTRCLSTLPPPHVATLIQGLHYSKAIRI